MRRERRAREREVLGKGDVLLPPALGSGVVAVTLRNPADRALERPGKQVVARFHPPGTDVVTPDLARLEDPLDEGPFRPRASRCTEPSSSAVARRSNSQIHALKTSGSGRSGSMSPSQVSSRARARRAIGARRLRAGHGEGAAGAPGRRARHGPAGASGTCGRRAGAVPRAAP